MVECGTAFEDIVKYPNKYDCNSRHHEEFPGLVETSPPPLIRLFLHERDIRQFRV